MADQTDPLAVVLFSEVFMAGQLARNRVSATLRQLRAVRSLSYEAVRERTGLSQQLLYDMEYAERRLTLAELRLLAECYDVPVNDIVGVEVEE